MVVWEETKNIFFQIISIVWMAQNKRSEAKHAFDKTVAKPVARGLTLRENHNFLLAIVSRTSITKISIIALIFSNSVRSSRVGRSQTP